MRKLFLFCAVLSTVIFSQNYSTYFDGSDDFVSLSQQNIINDIKYELWFTTKKELPKNSLKRFLTLFLVCKSI